MFVFYDFETSTREALGQILTYSFIAVTPKYDIVQECQGSIRPSRIELPDPEAILVSRLNVDTLMQEGQSEYEAAKKIHRYLGDLIDTYQDVTLVGFNSNQFDLVFLRNLFSRYGLNPYFFGKLKNLDILHFVQHIAFTHADSFPWQLYTNPEGNQFYQFKLETMAHAFDCLDQAQSHDAREDVLLTIRLTQKLEDIYSESLSHFSPIKEAGHLVKQKVRDFPKEGATPQQFTYRYWLVLSGDAKQRLLVNLEAYEALPQKDEEACLTSLKYINFNKHYWVTEPLSEAEASYWTPTLSEISQNTALSKLTLDRYFEKIKKKWDIDYQIHELGFKGIDRLYILAQELIKNPKIYNATFQTLWDSRRDPKDIYLIQLYNRLYLKYHPEPNPEHVKKYLVPRYVTGALYRDIKSFVPIHEQVKKMDTILQSPDAAQEDKILMQALKPHYKNAIAQYGL